MILIEKLKNISFLSSGKIDKYEYFTGEDILHSNQQQQQQQQIEQTKLIFPPLGKAFQKQTEQLKFKKL